MIRKLGMEIDRLGPYRIVRELGRGGMGIVYEAVSAETNQPAAVKLLSASMAREEGFRERFEAEIETLRKLKHPNIVRLFGFGEQAGHLFYAMELIDGDSLEAELVRGRRFDWREATRIGIQVCRALRHAHDRGVVHRDIKPGNLMLSSEGHVKLSDFGIARLFGNVRMTSVGSVLGTAEYMAPEQAEGRPVGPRADLYSLGAVLYALLTGWPVFRAKSLPEVLHKHRFERPDPVSKHVPDVPAMLDAIITQLLEKDPERRVPNPTVLSRQLEAMERALSLGYDPSHAPTVETSMHLPDGPDAAGPAPPAAADEQHPLGQPPPTRITEGPVALPPATDREASDLPPAAGPPPRAEDVPDTKATAAFEEFAAQQAAEEEEPAGRFTPVGEEELDRVERAESHTVRILAQAAGLALALIAVVLAVWYFRRSPSADTLYARITAQTTGGSIESLRKAEEDIGQFLALYPRDSRSSRLREYQNEIDLHRLEFRFELRAKGLGDTESLLPIERAYVDAINYVRLDPDQGMVKLRALLDLYADRDDTSGRVGQCLELARRRLERLRKQLRQQMAQHLALVQEQLDRADQLSLTEPERARIMYRAVIELYRDKPWAAAAVRRARDRLTAEKTPDS